MITLRFDHILAPHQTPSLFRVSSQLPQPALGSAARSQ
jgi:hypothetical protein